MGREIVKETTLADFINDPSAGNHREKYYTHDGFKTSEEVTLWDDHDHETGHFWNMSIDLTLCSGCTAVLFLVTLKIMCQWLVKKK